METATCPHCGRPAGKVKMPLVTRPAGVLMQLVALLLFVAAGAQLMGSDPKPLDATLLAFFGVVLVWIGRQTKPRSGR